jgi:hypothetical protein
MAFDRNPYPMRDLAEQLRAIGDQGYALAEGAFKAAEARVLRLSVWVAPAGWHGI